MSYFVVERSGDGGGLRIPLPTAYETREAAIAALSAATGSGEVTLMGEVFIADLESAVPVLVMVAAAPAAPTEAPAEEPMPELIEDESGFAAEHAPISASGDEQVEVASEALETESSDFIIEEAEPAALDAESADAVYTSWEPITDVAAESSTLADALKQAATTLEDDGIVAPDSVLSESDADEPGAEEPSGDDEVLGEPPVAQVPEAEEDAEWPWANVESYEVPDAAAADTPTDEADLTPVVSEPAGVSPLPTGISAILESLGEDAPIITSAPPEGEEAYVPHPVILGDYADVPLGPGALAEEPEVADEGVPREVLLLEDAVLDDVDAGASADDSQESAAEASLGSGYAPTGDLDLGKYTCQDCVYSNTCPKVSQVTPAECGSFQWKSE